MDPLIEVSVLNEKKFTTTKDDVGSSGTISWNEHLFFEPKNVVSVAPKLTPRVFSRA